MFAPLLTSVFISYAHADREIARKLARSLGRRGVRVWIDEGELRTGDSIVERIAYGIQETRFVVALISERSVHSHWCRKELALAVHDGLSLGGVRVLPLRIGNVAVPAFLRDVRFMQIPADRPTRIVPKLISDIRDLMEDDYRRGRLYERSCLDLHDLEQLRIALHSPEDDPPEAAMWTLVNDRSLPATTILFEEAVREAVSGWRGGYAPDGLAELGPAAAPWLLRMLSHPNNKVVEAAFSSLADLYIPNPFIGYFKVQWMLETLITSELWTTCVKRLGEAIPPDHHRWYFVEELLSLVDILRELQNGAPPALAPAYYP